MHAKHLFGVPRQQKPVYISEEECTAAMLVLHAAVQALRVLHAAARLNRVTK